MNHRNHGTGSGHNPPAKPSVRRDYKDSLFRMLFQDRTNLLSLYNTANRELLEACQSLKEYMLLMEQVRKYAAFLELNEAVDRAVNKCIRDGILSDFLSKHKAEVIAVSIFEYDEEREIRLIRQDEFRQGQQNILRDLVHKKLEKGKSPAVIADELELEPDVVETLIQELQKELSGSVL